MIFPRKVYALLNTVTKRIYIGSSSNVELRLRSHFSSLKCGKHSVEEMQQDYDEYGNHFKLFILGEIKTYDHKKDEYIWMTKLHTNDRKYGYNYKDRYFTNREKKNIYKQQGNRKE